MRDIYILNTLYQSELKQQRKPKAIYYSEIIEAYSMLRERSTQIWNQKYVHFQWIPLLWFLSVFDIIRIQYLRLLIDIRIWNPLILWDDHWRRTKGVLRFILQQFKSLQSLCRSWCPQWRYVLTKSSARNITIRGI